MANQLVTMSELRFSAFDQYTYIHVTRRIAAYREAGAAHPSEYSSSLGRLRAKCMEIVINSTISA
jgi:hypothetical protein